MEPSEERTVTLRERERIIGIIREKQAPRFSSDTVTEAMWNHVCEKLIDAIKVDLQEGAGIG